MLIEFVLMPNVFMFIIGTINIAFCNKSGIKSAKAHEMVIFEKVIIKCFFNHQSTETTGDCYFLLLMIVKLMRPLITKTAIEART